MSTPAINPIWRWLIFIGTVVAASALVTSAARLAFAARREASSDPKMWLRAAEAEPANADFWYRLGRYRQLDFEHSDLSLAILYYRRAISINPASSFYWMDLAGAYDTAGDVSQAEQAFRRARQLYPASAEASWRFGNFLLKQGDTLEAFQQIHDAVVIDPKLTALALSRCWRSAQDIGQILQKVLPDGRDENWGAIQFFVQAGEPVAAMAVWQRITAEQERFPASDAFPLLDMLVKKGHAEDARTVWDQALAAAQVGAEANAANSLVWNGGFERDPLDGGFDWRITPIEGATMSWDERSVHSGRRSLRVDFDGTDNVDFQNFWQYAVVQPATHYRFSAFFRTEDLSTDNGIRFEIRDVSRPGNPARYTPNLVGTKAWSVEDEEFVTGPDTKLLQIVLRRARSGKLGNKIRGTAWVDDVALVPVTPSVEAAR